jgi:uncharacterized membrane protein
MIAAGLVLFFIQIVVALFQWTLVLGARFGEYTLGGQNVGRLPKKLRVVSFLSMLVNLAIAGHYLAQTGAIETLLPQELNEIANWGLVGLTAIGLTMNAISRSKKERNLWVPVTIVSLVCSILVALGVAMNNASQ